MHRSKMIGILLLCCASAGWGKDFNGQKAFDFTAKAVSFGPRPPDSPANHQTQAYILAQLKTRGCELSEDAFLAKAPQGPVPMKNIICKFAGSSGKAIVFSGHYDTKTIDGFVGANDGGSSTGFLLEMAEALSGTPRKDDVYLVFFDGEEAYGEWSDTNSLYGSRHLAQKWADEGMLRKIKALINVDMIGDKDLNLAWNSGSTQALQDLVWATAARLGYGTNFPYTGGVTGDDHVPFIDRGVPSLDLIDFDDDYWHTTRDTMDGQIEPKEFPDFGECTSGGFEGAGSENVNGIVVVDKPADWTSHDVVAKFRGMAKTKSVGHLGTLDPIATGVLPLIVGNVTRLARFYTKAEKTYEAVVRFGFATDTYDRAGKSVGEVSDALPGLPAIERALREFLGPRAQMPPQYSAKKVGGRPAYESARRGIEVELKPVEIEIHELRVTGYDAPDLQVTVRCSGGTYVRSIAHDLGVALGCGAHLQELRRTQSGDFEIGQSRTLEQLQELVKSGRLGEAFLAPAELLPDFPAVWVDSMTAGLIRQGKDFHVSPFRDWRGVQFVKAMEDIGGEESLLAVGEAAMPNTYHPIVVLVN